MIQVYSTNTCPKCVQLKNFLKEQKIEFNEINLSLQKDKIHEFVKLTKQSSVPVTIINDKMIIGYDKQKILEALK